MIPNIDVTEYPEDGFAVLEDSHGKFIALRDSDEIIDLNTKPDVVMWPSSWNQSKQISEQQLRV